MNQSYIGIENIWKRYPSGENTNFTQDVINLLSMQSIKVRQDDGELKQVNISIPTSTKDSFVMGLRYLKQDDTFTEDHLLCRKDNEFAGERKEIEPFYKGRLENEVSEYKGTHKQNVMSDSGIFQVCEKGNSDSNTVTHVNTICWFCNEIV